MDISSRFITAAPSAQAVLDLFAGDWSSMMPPESGLVTIPGHAALFDDPRIHWAQDQLGSFHGKSLLELGPLEGAHGYMLQKMGAAGVDSVEANTRAFLKCLCIKEIFGLDRIHFQLGSFIPFLENSRRFDTIIACGVLYHMTDPLHLLDLIASRSDRIMLWTHYFDANVMKARPEADLFAPSEALKGTRYLGSKRLYPESALSWSGFSGGPESYAVWLERESILQFFQDRGYTTTINFDEIERANGPAFAICAMKS